MHYNSKILDLLSSILFSECLVLQHTGLLASLCKIGLQDYSKATIIDCACVCVCMHGRVA